MSAGGKRDTVYVHSVASGGSDRAESSSRTDDALVADGREQTLDKLHIRLILVGKWSKAIFVLAVMCCFWATSTLIDGDRHGKDSAKNRVFVVCGGGSCRLRGFGSASGGRSQLDEPDSGAIQSRGGSAGAI